MKILQLHILSFFLLCSTISSHSLAPLSRKRMMNIPTSVLGDMTKPVMRMGYLIQAMGQRMMALVKRNTGKHRQAQYVRGVHHHQPYINYHGSTVSHYPSPSTVDNYGSPAAPVYNTYYLTKDTVPNALHVITVNTDTKDNIDTEHDEYGSPQAPVAEYNKIVVVDTENKNINVNDNDNDVGELEIAFGGGTTKSTGLDNQEETVNSQDIDSVKNDFITNISDKENNDPEDIPQRPSSDYPDQNDPEKYLNNDQATLEKVINTPLFYNDKQDYFKVTEGNNQIYS